jgi:hypothetical protein
MESSFRCEEVEKSCRRVQRLINRVFTKFPKAIPRVGSAKPVSELAVLRQFGLPCHLETTTQTLQHHRLNAHNLPISSQTFKMPRYVLFMLCRNSFSQGKHLRCSDSASSSLASVAFYPPSLALYMSQKLTERWKKRYGPELGKVH